MLEKLVIKKGAFLDVSGSAAEVRRPCAGSAPAPVPALLPGAGAQAGSWQCRNAVGLPHALPLHLHLPLRVCLPLLLPTLGCLLQSSKGSSMKADELIELLKADVSQGDVPQSGEVDDEVGRGWRGRRSVLAFCRLALACCPHSAPASTMAGCFPLPLPTHPPSRPSSLRACLPADAGAHLGPQPPGAQPVCQGL